MPPKFNLIDLLLSADAIDVDDHFFRYFSVNDFNDNAPDIHHATILSLCDTDADGEYNYDFIYDDLLDASYDMQSSGWDVTATVNDVHKQQITLKLYTVQQIIPNRG